MYNQLSKKGLINGVICKKELNESQKGSIRKN